MAACTAAVSGASLTLTHTGRYRNQTAAGTAKAAGATTTATGTSSFTFTYNGAATAPTAAGSYTVVATLVNDNFVGTATDTLVIAKASQTITFAQPADKTYGDADYTVTAT